MNRLIGTRAAQIPRTSVKLLKHFSHKGCLGTLKFPASPFTAILGISAKSANVLCILDTSSAQKDSRTYNSLFFGSLGYFQNTNIKMKSTALFFKSVNLVLCVFDLKKQAKKTAYLACSSSVRSFPDTWKVCGYSSL